jgi:hypothetical protein
MTDNYAVPPEETLQEYLELLQDMRSVIRSDHISVDGRLDALDQIITHALGDSAAKASDFAQQVALGLSSPDPE